MQWWCAATTAEWSWSWRPYPGVWLVMLLIGLVYWRGLRGAGGIGAVGPLRVVSFGAGLAVLWIVLDWPVGALGGGYLLSVHTAQYVAMTLIAMPLMLAGIPAAVYPGTGRASTLLRLLARPQIGLVLYTAVMAATHVPRVTDTLMATQLGSFGIDLVWLFGAFALWWPVQAPAGYVRMSAPLQIGYLFAATIPPTLPAAFMVFADYPLYALYELAPRAGLAAGTDQQAAGLIMKAGGDPLLWIAMTIVYFRWQHAEDARERRDQAYSPQEQLS